MSPVEDQSDSELEKKQTKHPSGHFVTSATVNISVLIMFLYPIIMCINRQSEQTGEIQVKPQI